MTLLSDVQSKFAEAGFNKIASHIETAQSSTPKANGITVGSITKQQDSEVSVSQSQKLQTTTGWDYVAPMISPLIGGAYLWGQLQSVGQPTQKTQSVQGNAQDVIDVIKHTTPTVIQDTDGGSGDGILGGVGGILDKVIVAGVIIGGISLLKGVFK